MNIETMIETPTPTSAENSDKHEIERSIEVSVVMPCLNEAETLETCIRKAQTAFRELGLSGEVVIADNGSTDGSREIAFKMGARLIDVKQKGYGAAITGGVTGSHGKFVIMGDADDSYDFSSLALFLEKLRAGYDLVMGNRFKGGIKSGAMPL
jgi:glycosyltransferase involved in cell wall biosynthesis